MFPEKHQAHCKTPRKRGLPKGGDPPGSPWGGGARVPSTVLKSQTRLNTGHVLVVDDDAIVLKMVAKMFTSMGCKVRVAGDGREAWNKFEQTPSELVVTDFEMPIMNGFLLTRRIKSWEPAAKVIIMTGLSPESLADYTGDNLIDAWLFKPFPLSEIQAVLRRIGLEHLLY
jgi:CheY-like chemotaxis protein